VIVSCRLDRISMRLLNCMKLLIVLMLFVICEMSDL